MRVYVLRVHYLTGKLGRAASAVICASMCASCGDPMVRAAQGYEARMKLAIAHQYIQKAESSAQRQSEEVRLSTRRRAQLEAQRQAADSQQNARGGLAAQVALVSLDPSEANQRELQKRFTAVGGEAEIELDRRLSRGETTVGDYVACRRTAALKERAEALTRCDNLKAGLKQWVVMRFDTDVPELAQQVRTAVSKLLADGKHELVAAVDDNDERANQELLISLFGRGTSIEEPYTEVQRMAVRGMVPTGKKEKVTVPPSKDEIEKAKKDKKPTPEPEVVEKKLYRAGTGEYRIYRAHQEHRRPYAFALRRLRDARTLAAREGWAVVQHDREYFDYEGEEALREDPRGIKEGADKAPRAMKREELSAQAQDKMVDEIARDVVAAVEKDL